MKPTFLIAGCIACLLSFTGFAQCLPVISDTAACTGSEPLLTNNETVGAGSTRWFYGATSTFTNITIQTGGKVIVCGELQINGLSMQGGTLVITRSGKLTVNTSDGSSMVFRGGCSVYNLGVFKVLSNLVLDGIDPWNNPAQPNIIWNGNGASFEMPHTYFVLEKGNCFFVNNGTANFSGIINNTLSDSASVCLGNMSRMYVALLQNRRRNSYVAPAGPACVFIRNWGYSYEHLTEWPSVFLCRSATYCSGGCDSIAQPTQRWGSASLFNLCSSCAGMYLLPVQFTDVRLAKRTNFIELSWMVSDAPMGSQFIIQRSQDGRSFHDIDSFDVYDEKRRVSYAYSDKMPLKGRSFYRIEMRYPGNGQALSSVLTANIVNGSSVEVTPNPFKSKFTVMLPADLFVEEIKLFTTAGSVVYRQRIRKQIEQINIQPGSLPAGTYFVQIVTKEKTYNLRVVKESD
jgi:hypothetical protein